VYKTMEKHHAFFHSFSKGPHYQRSRRKLVEVNDISLLFNVRYIRLNKSKLPFLFSMFSPTFYNIDKLGESGFAVYMILLGGVNG